MKTFTFMLLSLSIALASCNRVKLPEGKQSAPYITVLEQGLTENHDLLLIPRGEVQIMSQLTSQMESADENQLKFKSDFLQYLQNAEKAGLVTLNERKQNELAAIGNMGARFITVTPTEKLLKLHSPEKSKEKFVAVPIGTIKVLEVLKEEEYKFPEAKPGDEFRIVLGRVRDTPTPQAQPLASLGVTTEPMELKFRAILQFNPFAKTYTVVASDVGKPEEAGWQSEFVK